MARKGPVCALETPTKCPRLRTLCAESFPVDQRGYTYYSLSPQYQQHYYLLTQNRKATPDASITNLVDTPEVEADLRASAVSTESDQDNTTVHVSRTNTRDIFTVGAKVEGNWRGHGKSGSRVSYDLVYDDDNEAEPGISEQMV